MGTCYELIAKVRKLFILNITGVQQNVSNEVYVLILEKQITLWEYLIK